MDSNLPQSPRNIAITTFQLTRSSTQWLFSRRQLSSFLERSAPKCLHFCCSLHDTRRFSPPSACRHYQLLRFHLSLASCMHYEHALPQVLLRVSRCLHGIDQEPLPALGRWCHGFGHNSTNGSCRNYHYCRVRAGLLCCPSRGRMGREALGMIVRKFMLSLPHSPLPLVVFQIWQMETFMQVRFLMARQASMCLKLQHFPFFFSRCYPPSRPHFPHHEEPGPELTGHTPSTHPTSISTQ